MRDHNFKTKSKQELEQKVEQNPNSNKISYSLQKMLILDQGCSNINGGINGHQMDNFSEVCRFIFQRCIYVPF